MQREINYLLKQHAQLLDKLPHLRNGLLLRNLKNKYPKDDLLKAMIPVDLDLFTKFGNYDDYYKYRDSDDRIAKLKIYLDYKDILDIGCHQGTVAADVYLDTDYSLYVGCDIDHSLVRKAICYTTDVILQSEYDLPKSAGKYLGLDEKKILLNRFNIQFNYADIIKYKINHLFDVVLCLSVIKWIHLEYRDAGLKSFIGKMYSLLSEDGLFVLELHDADSYWKKLHPSNYESYLDLEIIPDDIPNIVLEAGFKRYEIVELDNQVGGFQRRELYVFHK
eukprot:NODE_394_length_9435_cov_0.160347.p5 type:complete len:277 gc:universal NODE_394_length_9435_cov_0.160347:5238-4408(-)